jgi:hypothetical protein
MSALGQKQTCAAHKPMSAKCQWQTLALPTHIPSSQQMLGASQRGEW